MIYLYWYLAIGVVVLVLVFGAHLLSKKDESEAASDIQDILYPERKTLRYKIINNLLVPVMTGVFVIAIWPAAIFLKAKDMLSKKDEDAMSKEREFAVTKDDLLQEMSIEEIENLERVVDPLDAVPDLPFGHLHAAWKEAGGLDPEDAIWTFSSHWTTDWGHKEQRSGYVAVRTDTIGPYFLTMQKSINAD